MVRPTDETNTLVFEYHGQTESTETAFNRLLATLSESSPAVTGFRLELSTAEAFDVPFDELVGPQMDSAASTPTTPDSPTEAENDGAGSNGDADGLPSLQQDALPAQVLSSLLEHDGEPIRTSDLQREFDDADIDTSRISQTLASLKRRELVAAKPDPEDNRANLYWPTERGQQALRQL